MDGLRSYRCSFGWALRRCRWGRGKICRRDVQSGLMGRQVDGGRRPDLIRGGSGGGPFVVPVAALARDLLRRGIVAGGPPGGGCRGCGERRPIGCRRRLHRCGRSKCPGRCGVLRGYGCPAGRNRGRFRDGSLDRILRRSWFVHREGCRGKVGGGRVGSGGRLRERLVRSYRGPRIRHGRVGVQKLPRRDSVVEVAAGHPRLLRAACGVGKGPGVDSGRRQSLGSPVWDGAGRPASGDPLPGLRLGDRDLGVEGCGWWRSDGSNRIRRCREGDGDAVRPWRDLLRAEVAVVRRVPFPRHRVENVRGRYGPQRFPYLTRLFPVQVHRPTRLLDTPDRPATWLVLSARPGITLRTNRVRSQRTRRGGQVGASAGVCRSACASFGTAPRFPCVGDVPE